MKTFFAFISTAKPFFDRVSISKFIFIISFFFIAQHLSAQSGWFWESNIPTGSYNKIIFLNDSLGYIVGEHYNGIQYCVACWKTNNSGTTWDIIDIPAAGASPSSMFFLNEGTGWIGGRGLHKTTNGALSWEVQDFPLFTDGIHSIFFLNQLTGFISIIRFSTQTEGILFRTSNNGINWNNIYNQMFTLDMFFFNDSIGISCGYNLSNVQGIIKKTTNSGMTWYNCNYPENMTIAFSVDFVNNIGFICSSNGKVYKSIDLGESWILMPETGGNNLTDIFFINVNTGWAVGTSSICKTTNSGMNWVNQVNGPNMLRCSSVCFTNVYTGFILSESWLLKTTTGGGNITGNLIENNNIPLIYSLFQNIPNPFNPLTKIEFALPKASFTNLTIYDLLGREVATLINEELKPGTYEAEWDGSNFSSGIYFYKLETGDFTETKKMVLMK